MTQETETYLSHFARLEKELAGRGPSSLLPLRRQAMARFTELGFPTTKHEEWKYTSVAPITRTPFQPAGRVPTPPSAGGTRGEGLTKEHLPFGRITRCRLVFVNGRYAPELSALDGLPRGMIAGSLAAALDSDFELVETHLARYARYGDRAFVALNTALIQDGAFVHIPRGVVVE